MPLSFAPVTGSLTTLTTGIYDHWKSTNHIFSTPTPTPPPPCCPIVMHCINNTICVRLVPKQKPGRNVGGFVWRHGLTSAVRGENGRRPNSSSAGAPKVTIFSRNWRLAPGLCHFFYYSIGQVKTSTENTYFKVLIWWGEKSLSLFYRVTKYCLENRISGQKN